MAPFRMPPHLFTCEIDGGYIFLDLAKDRYFRLRDGDEKTFRALLHGRLEPAPAALARLAAAGVVLTNQDGKPLAPTRYPQPAQSLLETWTSEPLPALTDVVEVLLLLTIARRAARPGRLPSAIRGLTDARAQPAQRSSNARDALVRRFIAARRFVPGAPNCLHDSLALRRFLARRGFAPDLIVGVKLHPFGAHCWLQDRETVLNDTVAGARLFVPVLVA